MSKPMPAPGSYWLTSLGDGRGRAIVTGKGRLLVEQWPDEDGSTEWEDLTWLWPSVTSWTLTLRTKHADRVKP